MQTAGKGEQSMRQREALYSWVYTAVFTVGAIGLCVFLYWSLGGVIWKLT